MPRAGEYREARGMGLCVSCGQCSDGASRCPGCREKTRKTGGRVYVCTYCQAEGHNRRTCAALKADRTRGKEIDAGLVRLKASEVPDIKLEWERLAEYKARVRDALRGVAMTTQHRQAVALAREALWWA